MSALLGALLLTSFFLSLGVDANPNFDNDVPPEAMENGFGNPSGDFDPDSIKTEKEAKHRWKDLVNEEKRNFDKRGWTEEENGAFHIFRNERQNNRNRFVHFSLMAKENLVLNLEEGLGESGKEFSFNMKLQLSALIEYRDENNNGMFDPDADETVSEIPLYSNEGESLFAPLETREKTMEDGKTVKIVEVTTLDGHFRLVLYHTMDNASFDGNYLNMHKVKMDFEIHHYPFEGNDTRLALQGIMQKHMIRNEFSYRHGWDQAGPSSSGMELNDSEGVRRGFFSWAKNASVDGNGTCVNFSLSNMGYENAFAFSFSYERGDVVIHDPELGIFDQHADFYDVGINDSRLLQGSVVVFAITLMVSMVAFLLIRKIGRR